MSFQANIMKNLKKKKKAKQSSDFSNKYNEESKKEFHFFKLK